MRDALCAWHRRGPHVGVRPRENGYRCAPTLVIGDDRVGWATGNCLICSADRLHPSTHSAGRVVAERPGHTSDQSPTTAIVLGLSLRSSPVSRGDRRSGGHERAVGCVLTRNGRVPSTRHSIRPCRIHETWAMGRTQIWFHDRQSPVRRASVAPISLRGGHCVRHGRFTRVRADRESCPAPALPRRRSYCHTLTYATPSPILCRLLTS